MQTSFEVHDQGQSGRRERTDNACRKKLLSANVCELRHGRRAEHFAVRARREKHRRLDAAPNGRGDGVCVAQAHGQACAVADDNVRRQVQHLAALEWRWCNLQWIWTVSWFALTWHGAPPHAAAPPPHLATNTADIAISKC
jgi:hypothetical protein